MVLEKIQVPSWAPPELLVSQQKRCCHSWSARGKEVDVLGLRAGLEVHRVQCWALFCDCEERRSWIKTAESIGLMAVSFLTLTELLSSWVYYTDVKWLGEGGKGEGQQPWNWTDTLGPPDWLPTQLLPGGEAKNQRFIFFYIYTSMCMLWQKDPY